MKYGLIYYRDTHNLGDDILSYAGKRFLPKVDYYIDREHMDVFLPDEREYVAVIANGWYLHYNYTFQPSPYLHPFFIGTHFSKDQMILNDYSYLDASLIRYLQQHGPIGCRDEHTADLLKERQIPSYFSGCMTLTLPKFPDIMPNHKVVLVDVSDELTQHIKTTLPGKDILSITHRLKESEVSLDWNVREERLEEYLKLYQGADLVVTTRLHCALPCLALGTPVLFVRKLNEDFHVRIEPFAKYLPTFTQEEILQHKADAVLLNPPVAKSVEELAFPLIQKCTQFINTVEKTCPDVSTLPDLALYQSLYIDRTQYMRFAIDSLFSIRCALQNQIMQNSKEMEKTISLCNTVLDENERLRKRLQELS